MCPLRPVTFPRRVSHYLRRVAIPQTFPKDNKDIILACGGSSCHRCLWNGCCHTRFDHVRSTAQSCNTASCTVRATLTPFVLDGPRAARRPQIHLQAYSKSEAPLHPPPFAAIVATPCRAQEAVPQVHPDRPGRLPTTSHPGLSSGPEDSSDV